MRRIETWLYNEVITILAEATEAVVYQDAVSGKYVVEYYA